MLTIRKEQMEAFEQAHVLPRFEAEMMAHLDAHHPAMGQHYREEEWRAFIQEGVRRAKTYGADEPGAYALFIELMVLFGPGFDADPAQRWARAVLSEGAGRRGNAMIEALFEAGIRHLAQEEGTA